MEGDDKSIEALLVTDSVRKHQKSSIQVVLVDIRHQFAARS